MDIITYALLKKKIKALEEEIKSKGKFLGITTTDLTDGSTTNPIVIDNEYVTANPGDWTIVASTGDAFVFSDSEWTVFQSGVTDYEALDNLPRINGVELKGDKSFESLGREKITNLEIKDIIDEQYELIFGGGNNG